MAQQCRQAVTTEAREANLHKAVTQWATQLQAHEHGCLELHFTGTTVKGTLKVVLGVVKVEKDAAGFPAVVSRR